MVQEALNLVRFYGRGEIIDGAPAVRHATVVVQTLERHVPSIDPELAAGVLLHDTPYFTPDRSRLDNELMFLFGPKAYHVVRALEREHAHMATSYTMNEDLCAHVERLKRDDLPTIYASTADKIVSFQSILGRAEAAADPAAYWQKRHEFVRRLPYFHDFFEAIATVVPESMAVELGSLVAKAEMHTGFDRPSGFENPAIE